MNLMEIINRMWKLLLLAALGIIEAMLNLLQIIILLIREVVEELEFQCRRMANKMRVEAEILRETDEYLNC